MPSYIRLFIGRLYKKRDKEDENFLLKAVSNKLEILFTVFFKTLFKLVGVLYYRHHQVFYRFIYFTEKPTCGA